MFNEEEERTLLENAALVGGIGLGGTLAAVGARAAQRSQALNEPYSEALKAVAGDAYNDIITASKVLTGRSEYDKDRIQLKKDLKDRREAVKANEDFLDGSIKPLKGTLRQETVNQRTRGTENLLYADQPGEKSTFVRNPLTQAAISARDAFFPGAEDFLGFKREERLKRGVSPEGAKTDTVMSRIPLVDAARDLIPTGMPGSYSDLVMEDRRKQGIDLMKANVPQMIGGLAGRTASDFINNGLRSAWWLLNAPQAVVDVSAEGSAALANREGLYGLDYLPAEQARNAGWINDKGEKIVPDVDRVRYDHSSPLKNDPHLRRVVEGFGLPPINPNNPQEHNIYSRRRTSNNLSTLLALPAATAISGGLGLLNLTGGAEGRKAVFPDEEDPTKTSNVLAEVAAKYILGRQGDILPWEEYKKVRPDVTKDEYMRYKAYRYDKREDWDITDGDINILNGIIKMTDDGIDGAELMFLGKSMPALTTLFPTAGAIAGTMVGAALARHGGLNTKGMEDGIKRRETELESLKRKARPTDSEKARINQIPSEIDAVRSRQAFMENPRLKPFTSLMRRTGPIPAGLVGGITGLGATALIGSEAEKRRREGKIEEQNQFI